MAVFESEYFFSNSDDEDNNMRFESKVHTITPKYLILTVLKNTIQSQRQGIRHSCGLLYLESAIYVMLDVIDKKCILDIH